MRFGWELVGPEGQAPLVTGVDVGVVASDGRLHAITGFFDAAPVPQEGQSS